MSSPTSAIDSTQNVDTSRLAGKTAVITGGATGLGEAYVRALHTAGAIVVIGDMDPKAGLKLESELERTKFIQCDVTSWEDQLNLFKRAADFSPTGSIHYVIANAGIAPADDVFAFEEPQKPNLKTVEVNLHGALYTTKLALHYFVKQNGTEPGPHQEDTCLILISSGAGFLDVPRSVSYSSTKWAVRGMMHALRRTAFYCGSRVNVIAPWYVRTNILADEVWQHVQKSGVELATLEDAGTLALRLLSDTSINGKSVFLSPRVWAQKGYLDLDIEDVRGNELFEEIQEKQMANEPVELGLFPV